MHTDWIRSSLIWSHTPCAFTIFEEKKKSCRSTELIPLFQNPWVSRLFNPFPTFSNVYIALFGLSGLFHLHPPLSNSMEQLNQSWLRAVTWIHLRRMIDGDKGCCQFSISFVVSFCRFVLLGSQKSSAVSWRMKKMEVQDFIFKIKHKKSLAGFHCLSVPEMISHRKYYKLLF